MRSDGRVDAVNGSDKTQTLNDPDTSLSFQMKPGRPHQMTGATYERLRRTNPWLTRAHVHEARQAALAEKAIADKAKAKADAEERKSAAEAQEKADQEAADALKAEAEAAEEAEQANFERRYRAMTDKRRVAKPAE